MKVGDNIKNKYIVNRTATVLSKNTDHGLIYIRDTDGACFVALTNSWEVIPDPNPLYAQMYVSHMYESKMAHTCTLKLYEGLLESYHYCTICDKKVTSE